jgi:nucleotide-binding universal stress UspA family protein
MIAMRTILLPTDGSDCSSKALTYAVSFAKQYGARIVALHVIDRGWEEQTRNAVIEVGHELMQKLHDGYAREARRILETVTSAGATSGVPVETKMTTGNPHEEIVSAARDLSADLIVMGTHGLTGVSHFLLGSVAEKVVRRAPCPVLTVRRDEHDFVSPDLGARA